MIHTLRQKMRRATRRRAAGGGPVLRLPKEGVTVSTYGHDATRGNIDDFPTNTYSDPEKLVISVDDATYVEATDLIGDPAGHNICVDVGLAAAAIARLDVTYKFKQQEFNTQERVHVWDSNGTAWAFLQEFDMGGAGDIRTYTQAITANIAYYVDGSDILRLRHYQMQIRHAFARFMSVLVTPA